MKRVLTKTGDDAVDENSTQGQNDTITNPDMATAAANEGPSECKKQKTGTTSKDAPSSVSGRVAQSGVDINYDVSFTPDGHFKVEGEVKEQTVGEEVFESDSIELPAGIGPLEGGRVEICRAQQMMLSVLGDVVKKIKKGSASKSKSKTNLSIPSDSEMDQELDISRNIEGYGIKFNEHLILSKEVTMDDGGISFHFTGYENKLDKLTMKLGNGALAFHVASEDKIGKIRIQPPEGKSLSVISWKQVDNGVNVICK